MGFDPEIRLATPDDAREPAQLNALVHDPHRERWPQLFKVMTLEELDAHYRDQLRSRGVLALVATAEEEIVGPSYAIGSIDR